MLILICRAWHYCALASFIRRMVGITASIKAIIKRTLRTEQDTINYENVMTRIASA